MKIKSFQSVASQYKAIFFDSYGVLKNYNGLIEGVENTIEELRNQGIIIHVLTNDASRSPQQLAEKFHKLGLTEIGADDIISSGMMAREYLRLKVKEGTVAYLGTEDSAHYIETADLHTIPLSALDFNRVDEISALVLLDDEGFDWNTDFNKAINLLRLRNIPVVIANTDHTYPISGGQVALAIGGIGNLLENVVKKRFIRFGKPDSQMFIFAYEHLLQKSYFSKNEILMVGDSLRTDILGGNKFGFDTALVLTGKTLPKEAKMLIKTTGVIPDYVCESVAMG
ncbi:MAG: HAD-IIA family hydrolase [Chitinophagales bacterium]